MAFPAITQNNKEKNFVLSGTVPFYLAYSIFGSLDGLVHETRILRTKGKDVKKGWKRMCETEIERTEEDAYETDTISLSLGR